METWPILVIVALNFFVCVNGQPNKDEWTMQAIDALVDKVSHMQIRIEKLESSEKQLKASVSSLIGVNAKFRIEFEKMNKQLDTCHNNGKQGKPKQRSERVADESDTAEITG